MNKDPTLGSPHHHLCRTGLGDRHMRSGQAAERPGLLRSRSRHCISNALPADRDVAGLETSFCSNCTFNFADERDPQLRGPRQTWGGGQLRGTALASRF